MTRRAACLGLSGLAIPASCIAADVDPGAAADVIRREGMLKGTGKPVPPGLIGAIVIGAGVATASFVFEKPPRPESNTVERYTEEDKDIGRYMQILIKRQRQRHIQI